MLSSAKRVRAHENDSSEDISKSDLTPIVAEVSLNSSLLIFRSQRDTE